MCDRYDFIGLNRFKETSRKEERVEDEILMVIEMEKEL
jgi:hypothetical protein